MVRCSYILDHSQKDDYNKTNDRKGRKYMHSIKKCLRKKMLAICLVCTVCLSACGTDKNIEVQAERIVEAIESKNIKTVETIILGTEALVTDEDLADFFSDSESEEDGIISKIIEQDSIKVKKVTDDYIVYEITSPELSNMFKDVMKEENLTEDTFKEYIYNYIETANKVKIQTEIPYTYEDGVFTANYSTEEFINGITGNLITAYQELIRQMIEENGGENIE